MIDYDHGGGVPGNPALHSSSDISPGRDTRSSVQASVRRPVPASSPSAWGAEGLRLLSVPFLVMR